jgi:hypothetical protein
MREKIHTLHPAPPPTLPVFGVPCARVYGWTWLGGIAQLVFYIRRHDDGRWEVRVARKTSDPALLFGEDDLAVGTGASLDSASSDCEERLRMRGEAIREASDLISLNRSDLMLRYADPSL